ncbi:hypothetical protein [Streptomyces milbemycinicus]|uniref:Uncharacterized protein n=1 Tax=Streptomyces milbemycinicus TaxID=476552 RepID=A0ABW8LR80_9ACTN
MQGAVTGYALGVVVGAIGIGGGAPEQDRSFADHGNRLGTGNLDLISQNYTEDAVTDGVDTFVFRDGLISAQTVRYTLTPRTA